MKTFEAVPDILRAGKSQHIAIRQRIASRPLDLSGKVLLEIIERRNYRSRTVVPAKLVADPAEGNRVEFEFRPERPGEYLVHLNLDGARWPAESVLDVRLFALPDELHALRPYKGDMHMHTFWSDGDQSPAAMVARCKQNGLDFAAITDHRHWASSVEAVTVTGERGFDILMMHGEECNYCIGLGHILSYGAREAVSDRLLADSPFRSWAEVDGQEHLDRLLDWAYPKIESEVKDLPLPPAVDRRAFGFYCFIVQEIRRSGGVAVAAHPYWVSQRVVDLVSPVYEEVLRRGVVDAVELFGAVDFEDNVLSLVRMLDERGRGNTMPFWVSSDSHDVDFPTFGKQFTVAFSRKRQQDQIFDAILGGFATGCLRLENGEHIVIGEPLLVQYTYFLLREYFPRQDELYRTIGDLYQLELRGVRGLEDQKAALHRQSAKARDEHFA